MDEQGIDIKYGAIELLNYLKDKGICRALATANNKNRAERLLAQFADESCEYGFNKMQQPYIELNLDDQNRKEFIMIPSMVSYAASSALLPDVRKSYHGECEVLASILDFDYLWNEIRVQGGAYGCGTSISSNGSRNASSYRDPNPFHSLEVFRHQKEFIEEFLEDDVDLEPYIIGAYATTDPLVHVRQKAERKDQDYFLGFQPEDRTRFQQELLSTTKENLQKLRPVLSIEEGSYASCVIGSSEVLETLDEEEKKEWKVIEL